MDLKSLVDSIRSFEGITRKNLIKDVTGLLEETYNIAGRTLLGFGDDASALEIGNNQVILMAADGMWGKLMEADPWWAGYCSVLVNVNDIAAMGGIPIGMTNVLSTQDKDICNQIMDGINEGVKKFGVPMVGGHVHPDAPYNSLDVSITGIMNREDVITSCGAKPGDKVLVAIDLDGVIHPQFHLNWDTTTMKSAQLVQAQIMAMNELAQKHLLSAGKDISNPGTIGTLGMLLETSNAGATVELELIPRNTDVNWEDWLKLYPGAGFVLTAEEDNVEEVVKILEKVNISTAVVGSIISDKKLYLTSNGNKEVVFDFYSDKITGIHDEKP
ncbi:methanogenesis marker 2 protein [Methanobacterium formicicum]|uniref:Methanogenesis marker protein 2 n=1 Tax=Methanobacterium formicicum (strain DSM 3637 / PP1) TaxID=1204725 RepID=K2QYY6_METFP|nr:methanogenesis marker 2 protein [Methanobacterium formicicum]EKF85523.1 methanogenesis marker protein 2 [Methanobacterium formicicum DSM 3637]